MTVLKKKKPQNNAAHNKKLLNNETTMCQPTTASVADLNANDTGTPPVGTVVQEENP
jgi:hypothetical protein